jgi:GNAT superfamily N-acetyltransferase
MSTSMQRELEEAVVESWPATECQALDGWLLRSSGGPTHRGNSAATLGAGTARSLDERLASTEAWYRERGQPPQLQIGPCAAPAELDAVLEQRGYRRTGEAVAMTATAARVLQLARTSLSTRIEAQPGAAWRAIAGGSSRFASSPGVLEGFLARLGERVRCATAWVDTSNEPPESVAAAIGLGIRWGRWLGVYAMHTRPEQRRRGAARALLHALAQHALTQGVADLYLLVDPSNVAARALYAQCGFQDLYGYHYRVQGEPR